VRSANRLEVETGLATANARAREADDEVETILDEVVAISATTLAGLKFKAKNASERAEDHKEAIIESIVDDLLAFGSGEGQEA
jgi:hypothetical protein